MILLIDVDSRITNLALAKLSTYYKGMGEEVVLVNLNQKFDVKKPHAKPLFLNISMDTFYNAEKVFCSVVFSKNRYKVEYLLSIRGDIEVGGSGYNIQKDLQIEIEGLNPDYDLYDENFFISRLLGRIATARGIRKKAIEMRNTGIGYLYRGCPNKCSWCIVPSKEGPLNCVESDVGNLLNGRSKDLILLDNNLTAANDFNYHLTEIIDKEIRVNFSQGLDIRRIDSENAYLLSKVKKLANLHFSWDSMSNEKNILSGISTMSKYIKTRDLTFYMLVNFNTTFEEDFYRFRKLKELGCRPYVMIFRPFTEKQKYEWLDRYTLATDEVHQYILSHFARYVNGFFHKSPMIANFNEYEPIKKMGLKPLVI